MGDMERMAAIQLCDKNDSTLLTWKELKDGWGGCANFMHSYGLKPGGSCINLQGIEGGKQCSWK